MDYGDSISLPASLPLPLFFSSSCLILPDGAQVYFSMQTGNLMPAEKRFLLKDSDTMHLQLNSQTIKPMRLLTFAYSTFIHYGSHSRFLMALWWNISSYGVAVPSLALKRKLISRHLHFCVKYFSIFIFLEHVFVYFSLYKELLFPTTKLSSHGLQLRM